MSAGIETDPLADQRDRLLRLRVFIGQMYDGCIVDFAALSHRHECARTHFAQRLHVEFFETPFMRIGQLLYTLAV